MTNENAYVANTFSYSLICYYRTILDKIWIVQSYFTAILLYRPEVCRIVVRTVTRGLMHPAGATWEHHEEELDSRDDLILSLC